MEDRPSDRFLDVRQASATARVHDRTVRRWLDEGRLTKYQTATGRVRVAWQELTFICVPRPADPDN